MIMGVLVMLKEALSRSWAGLAMAAGLLATTLLYAFGSSKKREGREEERNKAKDLDNEMADEIRDRVERDLDDRVREFDGAGFRD